MGNGDYGPPPGQPIGQIDLPSRGIRFVKPSRFVGFRGFAGEALSTVLLCDSTSQGEYKNPRCDSHPQRHQRYNHKWREKL
jgi:hypothetical protein